jgi:hypothetical protein
MAKAKTNTNTGVSVMTGKTYMEKIQAEFANLKVIEETPYKTGGSFNAFGQSVNIRTETDAEALRLLVASVVAKVNALKLGDKALGLDGQKYTVDNHSVENIISDVQLRLMILNTENRRKELEGLIEEGKQFITIEDKRAMFEEKLERFGIQM